MGQLHVGGAGPCDEMRVSLLRRWANIKSFLLGGCYGLIIGLSMAAFTRWTGVNKFVNKFVGSEVFYVDCSIIGGSE